MKPRWHTGAWTEEDTTNLFNELQEAKTYRSLTNEEQMWEAERLKYWLGHSYLVLDAKYSMQEAAITYDEMNDNTEFQDALKLLGLWK